MRLSIALQAGGVRNGVLWFVKNAGASTVRYSGVLCRRRMVEGEDRGRHGIFGQQSS